MTTEFPPTDKPWGYFAKIALENIRCFASAELDLCVTGDSNQPPARWTIILGENGTGKTTLLQAIALMTLEEREPREGSLYGNAPRMSHGIRGAQAWRPKGDAIRDHDTRATIAADLLANRKKSLMEIDHYNFKITVSGNGWSSPQIDTADALNFTLPFNIAYGANRRINGLPQQEFQASKGYETLFSETVGLPNPSQWLLDSNVLMNIGGDAEAQAKAKWRYEQIVEALVRLLPGVSAVTIKAVEGRPAVMFKTDFGEVTIEQLSAGYRAMAAWVVDLASHMFNAYPESADPLSEPAVVLVDEFDLHLHPKWQREAIGFLTERFPAVQFIVTAHSPLVVQSAPDANIVVLKKVGDHVEIENDPVSVKTWRVDQILTSELFGLTSARPPEVDAKRRRLEALLLLDTRTAEQEAELERLDAELDEIAIGYDAGHIEALDFLKRVADELKGDKEP